MRFAIQLLALFLLPGLVSAATLVPVGSTWRYLDDGTDAGTAWRQAAFDDSAWASGPAELGYGDLDEATVVAGGTPGNRPITTYFRHDFAVTGASSITLLRLQILRDDGAVVYLNGNEIHRTNMPAGAISTTTPATAAIGGADEATYEDAVVSPAFLVEGNNVLAVEIHQSSPTSSDISFDLALLTELPGLERGPYLQLVSTNAATLRWRTNAPIDSLLQYGAAPDALAFQVSDGAPKTEHELRLSGLTPGTRYYYGIGSSTQLLAGGDAEHFFETAPAPASAATVRIWVIGDSGECAVSAQGCIDAGLVRDAYLARAQTGSKADLVLMLGDSAYNSGTDAETTRGVFETFGSVLLNTPVWPAPGNHEFGNGMTFSATEQGPYYDAFTLPRAAEAGGSPSGTEAYYSFDFGNVHLISLDSHDTDRSPQGAMYAWLEADLQANAADFTIAYWHHPPYSFGSHSSDNLGEGRMIDMREVFVPLLEDYGVDLVLTGHSHSYERSMLIDGHYGFSSSLLPSHILDAGSGNPATDGGYEKASTGPAPHEGTVYSVVGSSSKNAGGLTLHPIMAFIDNFEGSMLIEINGDQLDAVWIDSGGIDQDRFQIVKDVPEASANLLGAAALLSLTLLRRGLRPARADKHAPGSEFH